MPTPRKITDHTALTGGNTATGDLVEIVDVSDTTDGAGGTNKKITRAELIIAILSNLADGQNIPVGTTTGTKIGTDAAQKLGFFNATPVVQRTTYTQTYSTAARTVPAEVAAITGGESPTEAEHNALVADVLALKKLVNALIDDLQALGFVA